MVFLIFHLFCHCRIQSSKRWRNNLAILFWKGTGETSNPDLSIWSFCLYLELPSQVNKLGLFLPTLKLAWWHGPKKDGPIGGSTARWTARATGADARSADWNVAGSENTSAPENFPLQNTLHCSTYHLIFGHAKLCARVFVAGERQPSAKDLGDGRDNRASSQIKPTRYKPTNGEVPPL